MRRSDCDILASKAYSGDEADADEGPNDSFVRTMPRVRGMLHSYSGLDAREKLPRMMAERKLPNA